MQFQYLGDVEFDKDSDVTALIRNRDIQFEHELLNSATHARHHKVLNKASEVFAQGLHGDSEQKDKNARAFLVGGRTLALAFLVSDFPDPKFPYPESKPYLAPRDDIPAAYLDSMEEAHVDMIIEDARMENELPIVTMARLGNEMLAHSIVLQDMGSVLASRYNTGEPSMAQCARYGLGFGAAILEYAVGQQLVNFCPDIHKVS